MDLLAVASAMSAMSVDGEGSRPNRRGGRRKSRRLPEIELSELGSPRTAEETFAMGGANSAGRGDVASPGLPFRASKGYITYIR